MSRGLDNVKADIIAAYKRRDAASLRPLMAEYSARMASKDRSLANAGERYSAAETDGNFTAGMGRGAANVAGHVLQAALPRSLEHKLDGEVLSVSDEARAARKATDKDLMDTSSGKWGNFVGETMATAPVAGLAGGAARGAATKLGFDAAGKAARYGGWAAEGLAGQEATTGDASLGGALTGVAGGRAGQAIGSALGAAVKGLKRTDGAQTLLDYGADLTPGRLNPGGLLSRIERVAESSPLTGTAARKAREHATDDVVPNLIADIGGMGRHPGRGMRNTVDDLSTRVNSLYGPDRPIPLRPGAGRTRTSQADLNAFRQQMRASIDNHAPPSLTEVDAQLTSVWQRVARAKSSQEVKQVISDLRHQIRALKYNGKGQVGKFETARVYEDAVKWLDDYYKRGASPGVKADIDVADSITAQYKPIEEATVRGMKQGNDNPSGTQLLSALSKNMSRRQFSRGGGGETRKVAEALVKQQDPQLGVVMERMPALRQALAVLAMPVAAAAGSKGARRLAQGQTGIQKGAQKLAKTDTAQGLAHAIALLRAGSSGAAYDSLDEVDY